MPPLLPPTPPTAPPQLATVRSAPQTPASLRQPGTPRATQQKFKDLNTAQHQWLELLEEHGILRTSPTSQFFGPDQPVRRDELLLTEARLIELVLRREKEQQALIESLRAEIAQLRASSTNVGSATPPGNVQVTSLHPEPAVQQTAQVEIVPDHFDAEPVQTQPVIDTLIAIEPMDTQDTLSTRADNQTLLKAQPTPLIADGVRPDPLSAVDLDVLERHQGKLRQFAGLQRFLNNAARLDRADPNYAGYLRAYLAGAGMTVGQLTEATRQAAWYHVITQIG